MELNKPKNKPKRNLVRKPKIKSVPNSEIHNPSLDILEKPKEEFFTIVEGVEIQDELTDLKDNLYTNDLKKIFENRKTIFVKYIPWILILIFLIVSFYLWFQLLDIKKDPLKAVKSDISETVKFVGKIMLLPSEETPKIATLTESDLSKVKTQAFFLNAKVGDKVIVYSIARKVILYNPNTNKIVEVANLDSNSDFAPSTTF